MYKSLDQFMQIKLVKHISWVESTRTDLHADDSIFKIQRTMFMMSIKVLW